MQPAYKIPSKVLVNSTFQFCYGWGILWWTASILISPFSGARILGGFCNQCGRGTHSLTFVDSYQDGVELAAQAALDRPCLHSMLFLRCPLRILSGSSWLGIRIFHRHFPSRATWAAHPSSLCR